MQIDIENRKNKNNEHHSEALPEISLASPTDQPTDGRYQAKESSSFISY